MNLGKMIDSQDNNVDNNGMATPVIAEEDVIFRDGQVV
jgi:hypothetical protein